MDEWGDVDSALWAVQKQIAFAKQYFDKQHSYTFSTNGHNVFHSTIRKLGMSQALWAHIQHLELVDDESIRSAGPIFASNAWRTEDGKHSFQHPDYW